MKEFSPERTNQAMVVDPPGTIEMPRQDQRTAVPDFPSAMDPDVGTGLPDEDWRIESTTAFRRMSGEFATITSQD
jgi:hypothetical protein